MTQQNQTILAILEVSPASRAESAPGLIADGVVARGATYQFLIGCDDGALWGRFGCGGVFAPEAAQGGQPGDSGGPAAGSAASDGPVRSGGPIIADPPEDELDHR